MILFIHGTASMNALKSKRRQRSFWVPRVGAGSARGHGLPAPEADSILRARVFEPDDLAVLVVPPGGPVLDQVETAILAEFEIHRALEGHVGTEALHLQGAFRVFG